MEKKRESGTSKQSPSNTKALQCSTPTKKFGGREEECCPGHTVMEGTVFSFLQPPNVRAFLPEVQLSAQQWAKRHIEMEMEAQKQNLAKKEEKADGAKEQPLVENDQREMSRENAMDKSKDELTIISRDQWNAMPPKLELRPRRHPFTVVILGVMYLKQELLLGECTTLMKIIQANDMRGYDDIQSNFVVGKNGLVYEGRGWDAVGKVPKVLVIDFVENNIEDLPSPKELAACKRLIQKGVQLGKIQKEYHLTTFRSHRLHEMIMKWKNFAPHMEYLS